MVWSSCNFTGLRDLRAQRADEDVQAVEADIGLSAPAFVDQHRVRNDGVSPAHQHIEQRAFRARQR